MWRCHAFSEDMWMMLVEPGANAPWLASGPIRSAELASSKAPKKLQESLQSLEPYIASEKFFLFHHWGKARKSLQGYFCCYRLANFHFWRTQTHKVCYQSRADAGLGGENPMLVVSFVAQTAVSL